MTETVITIAAVVLFPVLAIAGILYMRNWMRKQGELSEECEQLLVERYGLLELEDQSYEGTVEGVAVELANVPLPAPGLKNPQQEGVKRTLRVVAHVPSQPCWILTEQDRLAFYSERFEVPEDFQGVPGASAALGARFGLRSDGGEAPAFLEQESLPQALEQQPFVLAIANGEETSLWVESKSIAAGQMGPFEDVDRALKMAIALARP